LTGQINQSIKEVPVAERRDRRLAEEAAAFRHKDGAGAGQHREVQASVAKTHFSQLLDDVERGETIVILRHGRPIARIVPDEQHRRERQAEAIESIRKIGREVAARNGPITVEEIISSIHEGHKY
jgi:prevent-host-death family protein